MFGCDLTFCILSMLHTGHKGRVISNGLLEHDNELLQWSLKSPEGDPIDHLRDVVERQTSCATVSTRTNISEECFQQRLQSAPQRILAVLKGKWF